MLLSNRQRFHLDSFRMVLSLQASIDAQDTEGNTGTSVNAAPKARGKLDILGGVIDELLLAFLHLSAAALHHASKNDVGLAVRMLLDSGADPTIVNAAGETPLDLARKFVHPKSSALHLLEEDHQLQQLARWTSIPVRGLACLSVSGFALSCIPQPHAP